MKEGGITRDENAALWLLLVIISFELIDSLSEISLSGVIDEFVIIFNAALIMVLIVILAALGRRLCLRC
ncbi:MAG: hypothetical protein RTU92_12535 [Candidatus Thorarchaeota archaeon]